ncbi:energy transducer TonB [Winogradskyella sp. 3972H.M.0a.05]|uniref:energy transducer TonB n=1 Tax=Winogradskyella sp. 3972H.M.0a.05 TaxID=2950277 RepID=UPI00339965F9
MLHYLTQAIGFQLIFLIIYDLFLKKETFFNYNRLYLLVTIGLSFALPFIEISRFQGIVPDEFIVRLPEVVIGEVDAVNSNIVPLNTLIIESSSFSILKTIFFTGFFVALFIFFRKLYKLYALAQKSPKQREDGFVLVKLFESSAAFSFFNLVFVGEELNNNERDTILKHEIIHVKQKHTLDLLIFEILRIVFWFNPLIYIYQNRIASLHEYIADSIAIKQQNKKDYYQNLLQQVFDVNDMSFINTFFNQSLIKKRIFMLSKEKSKQILKLKYVLLIPVVCSMLFYSSCSAKKTAVKQSTTEQTVTEQTTSPLTNKVDAIKQQIMVQGNVNPDEERGIALLAKTIESRSINQDLVKQIQDYIAIQNKTTLMTKIADLFDQMQAQGHLQPFEEKALKGLLVLTTDNGLNNPLYKDVAEEVEVPFGVIDEVPVHPSCASLTSNADKKACLSKNISMHVNRNFNMEIAKQLGLEGRQRINVLFKIDKNGDITGIRARAPHPDLEEEAKRVIATLPKFTPGKHQGKAVIVPYSLPIIFQVHSEQKASNDKSSDEQSYGHTDKIPFTKVDLPPAFLSCASVSDVEELRKCTSQGIAKYINKKFNLKLAEDLGLKGKHRIEVIFKINKRGEVTNVKARASHPDLEEEVIRIIYSMPNFVPGKHKGEVVDVMYSLPIEFLIAA